MYSCSGLTNCSGPDKLGYKDSLNNTNYKEVSNDTTKNQEATRMFSVEQKLDLWEVRLMKAIKISYEEDFLMAEKILIARNKICY